MLTKISLENSRDPSFDIPRPRPRPQNSGLETKTAMISSTTSLIPIGYIYAEWRWGKGLTSWGCGGNEKINRYGVAMRLISDTVSIFNSEDPDLTINGIALTSMAERRETSKIPLKPAARAA